MYNYTCPLKNFVGINDVFRQYFVHGLYLPTIKQLQNN